jgi:hypothetical protein
MHQIKLDILANGGKIYYSDTDSLATNLSLDQLKEIMPERIDNNLGQLKFEHNVNEAFFISNKTYVLKTKVGKEIKKAKGAVKYSIPYSHFQYLYLHSKSIKANKTFSTINYSKGSVTIETKEIDINWDSYTSPKASPTKGQGEKNFMTLKQNFGLILDHYILII